MTHIELFLDISAVIFLAALLVHKWLIDRRAMYYAHLDYLFHALQMSDESEDACNQAPDNDAHSSVSP